MTPIDLDHRSSATGTPATETPAGPTVTAPAAWWRPSFPRIVDERSTRLVAAGVVGLSLAALLASPWFTLVLAAGFALRLGYGPRLSPLSLLATRVVLPRLGGAPRPVPGAPKRFAQGIGLVCSSAAALAWAAGSEPLMRAALVVLVLAAALEAFAGVCLGCKVFAVLMRTKVIPASVCVECADITTRLAPPAPTPSP